MHKYMYVLLKAISPPSIIVYAVLKVNGDILITSLVGSHQLWQPWPLLSWAEAFRQHAWEVAYRTALPSWRPSEAQVWCYWKEDKAARRQVE